MSGIDNKSFNDEDSAYSSKTTFDIAENDEKDSDKKQFTESKLDRMFRKFKLFISRTKILFFNVIVVGYLAWATYHFIESKNQYEASTKLKQTNETEEKVCGVEYCGIQWCDGYGMLIIVLAFIYVGLLYYQIKRSYGKRIVERFVPTQKLIKKIFSLRLAKITLIGVAIAAFAVFLAFDTIDSRSRLQSLTGIVVLLGIGFVFSTSPTKIRLRPVICGFTCQILLGMLCIRWEVGRSIFKCLGDKMATLLAYSTEVARVFAFSVLPVIFFVSFLISILNYLGAMQWIVLKIGWVLQSLIGTTVCESLACAANIFLGMTETPLLIKQYIKYLTRSQIHVIMASGFATVSGSVLAAYISYGAEPAHLVTSSVMAAPAALCFAKLFYPETEESKTNADNIQLEKSTDTSICDWDDCEDVAKLIATKTMINEFVAYERLGKMKAAEVISASDDSVEEHAFDDIKSLVKNDGTTTKSETMSTLSQTSFNYINSIVGSGVIGIPYAFHRAVFGLGFLLLILVAVITDYSLILMVRCGHMCGRFSYPGVMEAAYGKWDYYFLSLVQFMYPFLAMISYNVVVGDTMSKVLIRFVPSWELSMGIVRFGVVFAVTVCVVIPLCLYKNVSRLARASFISLACVVFILFAVVCKFFSGDYDAVPDTPESWRFSHIDVIPATGIMAFAFMCHHNTFLVYQSMQDASLERWEKVTHISIGFAFCVAALFGIAGYSTFRALSQGDLLENYCWDDDLMNFSIVLFSISILLTFPIECFVSREIVKAQIDRSMGIESSNLDKERDPTLEKGENDESSVKITLAIVLTAFIISPMTECLGPVLELNGLLAAIPLAYILPGLAYIKMEPHSLTSRENLPAVGLVVFGTIVTVARAAVLLPGLLGDCKSNIDLGYCKSYDDDISVNLNRTRLLTTMQTRT